MKNKDIIKSIQELKNISPRSEWQSLNRDFLLQKITADQPVLKVQWFNYLQFSIKIFGQKLFEPAVAMLLMLGIFSGSSLIVNAAFYSMPGDNLYRLKIALENTHVAITSSEEKKVELKMEFAKNRLEELDKIVKQPDVNSDVKKEMINMVVKEFKNNVVSVKDHIEKINTSQPQSVENREKTLRMALTVSSQTNELAQSLDKKSEGLTDEEKINMGDVMADAVASAQETVLSAKGLIGGEAAKDSQGEIKGEEYTIQDNTVQPNSDDSSLNDSNGDDSGSEKIDDTESETTQDIIQ